jgi:enoyl-CoA hydratase
VGSLAVSVQPADADALLRVDAEAGTTTLTLARPARGNALSPALVEALLQAVQQAAADPGTHTLLLRGEGRHFCTGLDLSELESLGDGDLLWRLVRIETLLAALWHAPMRTVAVAQGRAWGAGADLFAACEHRVAMPDATFRFPGARFGIVLGTRRLAERVGTDAAREAVIGGLELDAEAALRTGLASADHESPFVPVVDATTARALRAATREDRRDADLAALVRSAAEPGLKQRVTAYRQQTAQHRP